ncbi:hypothetical protein CALVIDRAFT_560227 [Calocera viscosa TUFC12733]|uniref:Lanthionine synthetase C family protein n=1 Tax=Calocera viscosa (strain TUFC12733) TaxID=1330018 RepID=A0A167RHT8_CALVF|nr:hypothetical protein CALVIDRAFT_560227 [Calocera viscosa TUFC12733]
MAPSSERYVPNTLSYNYDANSIDCIKRQLESALLTALSVIPQHQPESNRIARPRLYTGAVGHSVLYLRLYLQAASGAIDLPPAVASALPRLVKDTLEPCLTYPVGAIARAASDDPEQRRTAVSFGKVGALDTPVGPALIELTRQLVLGHQADDDEDLWETALRVLKGGYDACGEMNLEEFEAGDMVEILYGTCGYLYALLGLRAVLDGGMGEDRAKDASLTRLTSDAGMGALVDNVIRSGASGAMYFQSVLKYGMKGPPLMWRSLHEKYYLGGIHGIAGILLVLLQCPPSIITVSSHLYSHILPTIDWLLTLQKPGNTPSSITPGRQPSYRYCQFCHGAPGTALMLLALRDRVPEAMDERDQMGRWRADKLREALDCIWREGIVRKGIGLCHGIAGNAMPFLLQAVWDLKKGNVSSESLGKALALLSLSATLPPMPPSASCPSDVPPPSLFRTPDNPYSLFEGLAGAACVWADALALLQDLEERNAEVGGRMIGFPMVGGLRVRWPL